MRRSAVILRKRLAPGKKVPYAASTKLEGRLPYALNREFLFARLPEIECAQTVGYPRGPRRPSRRGNSLGIFIFRRYGA